MSGTAEFVLAIDTSTETAGLALYNGERASELIWPAGRNQTTSVLRQIDRLLELNSLGLPRLGAVVVATGPGSFNGLRVGLSVAKGLCYGLGIPLIGVETLDIVAYPHVGTRAAIRAFVAAGRGRAVFADYRHRNGRWVRLSELRNEPVADLASNLAERTLIVGELSTAERDLLSGNPLAVLPSPALCIRRPSNLAEIGRLRWKAGDMDDLHALEPVYVHSQVVAPSAV